MTRPQIPALSLVAAPLPIAPAAAETPSNRPEDGAFVSQVVFHCARGALVPVAHVNVPTGEGFAVARIDGQQVTMKQVVPGSGVRFRSVDADRPHELHTKGPDGTFYYGPEADAPAILGDCTVE